MLDKKARIQEAAKRIFSEKGFKKTNISEIMKSADMATGTFYNYFGSKDEVFMVLYMEENENLKKDILSQVDLSAEPMTVMGQLMILNEQGMRENPILCEWYNKDVFYKIEKSFKEKKGLQTLDFMYTLFTDLVKKWQEEGIMRNDMDANMIMAIFNALIHVETHKEDIGIQYFPDLMTHLSEFVMNGLLKSISTK